MTYTYIGSSPVAGFYSKPGSGSWMEMTCILKEGNITYASGSTYQNYLGGYAGQPFITFASPLAKGSLVEISTDTANTYTATGGLPVVQATSGAVPQIGFLLSDPENIEVMPSSSQTTWSTMLAGKYYRIANVAIFCDFIMAVDTPAAASNNITPGNSVIYDNSSDGFVYGRPGLSFADTAVYDSSGADTGANGYLTEPIALHYSASNSAQILIAHGMRPMAAQA